MPLRSDSTLWFNLPGVVAAYQPVRAPGPLLARFNMAHGGNIYCKLTPVGSPNWVANAGWRLISASSQYFVADISLNIGHPYTLVATAITTAVNGGLLYIGDTGVNRFAVMFGSSGLYAYAGANAATAAISLNVLQGFAGLFEASVSRTAYVNYLTSGSNTTSTAIAGTATKLLVGARYTTAGAIGNYLDGWVTACAFYERALSAAEILTTYRQMAYCHVNPDWSAWSRRRKWFYAAGEPGEITGQAAVALANLSPSAAGTVDIAGAAAATLANLTGQSAGAVEILGAAGTALANVASQAAGIVDIAGSGAANLAELLPSAEGSVTAAGAAAITLAGTTGAATASIGEAPITGQGEVTLANPAAQGTGGVAVSGAGNITLAGLTGQAAGAVSISGAAGVTLAGMVELAAGQASISGSAAEQFAEMVSAAAGVVVGYIPATQYIGLSLARRSFEWHISERAKDL